MTLRWISSLDPLLPFLAAARLATGDFGRSSVCLSMRPSPFVSAAPRRRRPAAGTDRYSQTRDSVSASSLASSNSKHNVASQPARFYLLSYQHYHVCLSQRRRQVWLLRGSVAAVAARRQLGNSAFLPHGLSLLLFMAYPVLLNGRRSRRDKSLIFVVRK